MRNIQYFHSFSRKQRISTSTLEVVASNRWLISRWCSSYIHYPKALIWINRIFYFWRIYQRLEYLIVPNTQLPTSNVSCSSSKIAIVLKSRNILLGFQKTLLFFIITINEWFSNSKSLQYLYRKPYVSPSSAF